MRFRNAAGLVDLPIYAVEHRFRNEPVLTVLPVRGAIGGRDALLVALPTELATIIADPERQDDWMTYLAPWEVVRVGELESEAGIHRLEVHIDSLVLLAEGPQHWSELRAQIEAGRIAGPRVHDARIAALCLSHGVRELWTADRDFSRFTGVRARNPLVG